MRTEQEVVAYYESVKEADVLGFKAEVLLGHLSPEAVRPFCKPDADLSEWRQSPLDEEAVTVEAAEYMSFAWGKVQDHRGISAGRSVDKIEAFAWLLGRDDVVAAMESAEYTNYGAPKLMAACLLLGLPWPESPDVKRMSEGLPCRPDCEEGCAL